MTLALQGARLPTAFAASLAIHAALAAALALVAGGWLPGSRAPAAKPDALLATLRTQPVPAPHKTAAATRPARGAGDATTGAALPKPYYLPAAELTERPLPLAAIEPSFPSGASATGRVKMRLYINEHGAVDAVDITEAEPAGEFEQAAVEAFSEARFTPGRKDGTAVKSQIALEVRFGEPSPLPASAEQATRARPDNPNAYDAPDRIGIKTRRPR
ncbi:MAG TPA: TonB family protein [Burkholderiales bacterium]|jgi:TonB family protein|nr:TonB family protein [Burkholderiales bacterium]